ncbi:MAG: YifB family Mg chelatase-like AAA ATPase [Firmicutes bacterium]|nr:YifB family Mg chelatase-like AAA ATPase [Bacillota bacterium]
MLTRILSASLAGLGGEQVHVEVDILRGLPGYHIVGLAGTSIRESQLRIQSAMRNSGIEYPARKIAVNLAPAGTRKEGTHFDLPIALGIAAASGIVKLGAWSRTAFFGELSLNGQLVGVRGALPLVLCAAENGIQRVVIPAANAEEVSLVEGVTICPCASLAGVIAVIGGRCPAPAMPAAVRRPQVSAGVDYADVMGQEAAKRAFVIAASGAHGMLMIGAPGCGKSMMAERMVTILPPMTKQEQMEVTKIYSVAGLLDDTLPWVEHRPFRRPHHSITKQALLGGGLIPRPGEFSLAHYGVLFLDELGEFDGALLDSLRQPLEEDKVTIARAQGTVTFPGKVILVAASNPCRCGHLGDPQKACICTPQELRRYRSRLSGPFMERIDLHLQVPRAAYKEASPGLSSGEMRQMVMQGRAAQQRRFAGSGILFNSQIPAARLGEYCGLDEQADSLLRTAGKRMGLSMRTFHKTLRIARTIADIDGVDTIGTAQIGEALQYRPNEIRESTY